MPPRHHTRKSFATWKLTRSRMRSSRGGTFRGYAHLRLDASIAGNERECEIEPAATTTAIETTWPPLPGLLRTKEEQTHLVSINTFIDGAGARRRRAHRVPFRAHRRQQRSCGRYAVGLCEFRTASVSSLATIAFDPGARLLILRRLTSHATLIGRRGRGLYLAEDSVDSPVSDRAAFPRPSSTAAAALVAIRRHYPPGVTVSCPAGWTWMWAPGLPAIAACRFVAMTWYLDPPVASSTWINATPHRGRRSPRRGTRAPRSRQTRAPQVS